MLKLFILIIAIFLFMQTPIYKKGVLQKYNKFESNVTKLLTAKPEDLKQSVPVSDPVYRQPSASAQPAQDNSGESLSAFMSQNSVRGVSRSSSGSNPGVRTFTIKY